MPRNKLLQNELQNTINLAQPLRHRRSTPISFSLNSIVQEHLRQYNSLTDFLPDEPLPPPRPLLGRRTYSQAFSRQSSRQDFMHQFQDVIDAIGHPHHQPYYRRRSLRGLDFELDEDFDDDDDDSFDMGSLPLERTMSDR